MGKKEDEEKQEYQIMIFEKERTGRRLIQGVLLSCGESSCAG